MEARMPLLRINPAVPTSCKIQQPFGLLRFTPFPRFLPNRLRWRFFQLHTRTFLYSSSSYPTSIGVQSSVQKVKFSSSTVDAAAEASPNKLLHVVLVSPQIPGNTGCIARTCAASAVSLHLVGPIGFEIDYPKLKRAGLDYWPYVVVKIHRSWAEFRDYFDQQEGDKRLLAFTKRGTKIHSNFSFKRGDWLVFGSETSGLPPDALNDCINGCYGGGGLRIPMVETYVRCLNLSVSVGIALYEASRQLEYEQLQIQSDSIPDKIFRDDIFG